MNYSYMEWKKHLMDEDVHAMAILSFPAVTKCATTVQELVQNAELQSAVMRRIKEEFPLQEALVSMMDLSVEAQAFGCPVSFHEGEIPAVTSGIIKNREDGEALRIPKMEEAHVCISGRCGEYHKGKRPSCIRRCLRALFTCRKIDGCE